MFCSGYVAIVGGPNVGKSTLINKILGEKLSIVTKKPQTTRHRILGILNRPSSQVLFLDTPGIHLPKTPLQSEIVEIALKTLPDADLILHMIEPNESFSPQDSKIAKKAKVLKKTYFVLINKVDRVAKEGILTIIEKVSKEWSPEEIFPISAKYGEGVEDLVTAVERKLPEGPAYYPTDIYTERDVRFLCEEIVREKAMTFLHQEIPYDLVAQVEEFQDREKKATIHIAIILGRESHKSMAIGSKGAMIKRIGKQARQDIEKMLGKKVHLELFVKVVKDWHKRVSKLHEYGICG